MTNAGAAIACAVGCDYCCHLRVGVFPHEAVALHEHLRTRVSPADAAVIAQRIRANAQRIDGLTVEQHRAAGIPCALSRRAALQRARGAPFGLCDAPLAEPRALRARVSASGGHRHTAWLATRVARAAGVRLRADRSDAGGLQSRRTQRRAGRAASSDAGLAGTRRAHLSRRRRRSGSAYSLRRGRSTRTNDKAKEHEPLRTLAAVDCDPCVASSAVLRVHRGAGRSRARELHPSLRRMSWRRSQNVAECAARRRRVRREVAHAQHQRLARAAAHDDAAREPGKPRRGRLSRCDGVHPAAQRQCAERRPAARRERRVDRRRRRWRGRRRAGASADGSAGAGHGPGLRARQRSSVAQPGAGRLADDPPRLQRVELQPLVGDHREQREPTAARVDLADARRRLESTGAARLPRHHLRQQHRRRRPGDQRSRR